jgi:mRNA interferase MazF
MERGEVWWAHLSNPIASEPGFNRPVLVFQSDIFNRSRMHTIVAVVLTANLRLSEAPGNVLIPAAGTGLPKDSVANVSQVITLDQSFLTEKCCKLPPHLVRSVDEGLRFVLSL